MAWLRLSWTSARTPCITRDHCCGRCLPAGPPDMLIAWQTVNAVRRPGSTHFTRGFLVVAPGLTIKDRLRVLQPNDPDSYYANRELVPADMLDDIQRAKIVITNYHAFKLRERLDISKGGRALLQGRGEPLKTLETEGQMIQRVMPDLMGLKNILVLNDEAHHCYRERPGDPDEEHLAGDEKQEAEKNKEAARLWITGLEIVKRKIGITRVIDLSATPFFLSGSNYAEGTLLGLRKNQLGAIYDLAQHMAVGHIVSGKRGSTGWSEQQR